MEETLTYRAQMGTRSLQVKIDRKGNITLPPDTTLEDGTYTLSYTPDGGEEQEVGAFEAKDGKVGLAYSTRRRASTMIVIDIESLFNLQPITWAQELEEQIRRIEDANTYFDGKICGNCGQVHTLERAASNFGIDPQEMVNLLKENRSYLEDVIVPLLKHLITEGNEQDRYDRGYDTVEQMQNHLDRITAALEIEPITVPPQATPPTPEPEQPAHGG